MPNTAQIPWKSITAESIAIVISILLAFAIDAWWEERRERQFEQESLDNLRSEYLDHRRAIEWQIDFHVTSMRAIADIMAACRSGAFESEEFSIDDALYYLRVPMTTDLGSGVRDALLSAGRIDVLRDKDLRYELAEWDSVLLELTDSQLFNREYVREIVYPYMTRKGIPTSGSNDQREGRPWPLPARFLADEPETTKQLITDNEFCSILDVRYADMDHTRTEYENLLSTINRILGRIEQH
jgi:hypothetical protein